MNRKNTDRKNVTRKNVNRSIADREDSQVGVFIPVIVFRFICDTSGSYCETGKTDFSTSLTDSSSKNIPDSIKIPDSKKIQRANYANH